MRIVLEGIIELPSHEKNNLQRSFARQKRKGSTPRVEAQNSDSKNKRTYYEQNYISTWDFSKKKSSIGKCYIKFFYLFIKLEKPDLKS